LPENSSTIGGVALKGKARRLKEVILLKARTTVSLLKFKSFDTSTEEGRSKERYRRAMLTSASSIGAKGISILTALISVPLTLNYLGVERYGLWLIISSIILLLGFADLGIGNGLLNAISEANGKDDREAAHRYVSSSFFMLSGVAIVLMVGFAASYAFIPWRRLLNVTSPLALQEAGPAMAVFVACFSANMPLGVVQRVQLGYQEGFKNNLWQGAGNILGLFALLLAISVKAGLAWLVLAMAGGPVLAAMVNWAIEFHVTRPWLAPVWKSSGREAAQKILGIGFLFFILQLAVALAFTSDNIVAAQMFGPEAVTQYAVPMRLFTLIGYIVGMLFGPLWPAYGEAIARRDIEWAKQTLVRSLWLALLVCGLPAVAFVIFGKAIVQIWVGSQIQPSFSLLLGMGIWAVLGGLGTTLSSFLNGANVVRFQVICASFMAISALGLKIWFAGIFGLAGIIWGTVIAYILFSVIPSVYYVPLLFNRMQTKTPFT
jgi:O-antigen/teichoic acid export membrane protein